MARYKAQVLEARIRFKWMADKRHLPLRSDHWELYRIIHRRIFGELGEFPNLVNPRDFNDRIQWLKLFDQTEEHVRCSDKLRVKDYVRERVGEDYLVQLYQVCERFDDIDFERLPKSFVIKTNHDSGTVVLVRDKTQLDREAVRTQIETSLQQTYGWENGEWAYAFVEPKILVEEFLRPEHYAPPPDYKFQCVDGKVQFCRYAYDRGIDTKEVVTDREGMVLDFIIDENFKRGSEFKRPEAWHDLIKFAETLSDRFKCVRVDLFQVNGRTFFGELTFFPYFGAYKGEGQTKVGPLLDFDRTTFKQPIYHKLTRPNSERNVVTVDCFKAKADKAFL